MGLELIGEVALDGSGFERGLNAMTGSVKGFIAQAFGLYAIESMFRRTLDTMKDLATESQRLGLGTNALQVLKQAAKDGATEMTVLIKAFEALNVARAKALSGSKEGMELLGRFAQLGISQKDLQIRSAAELFMGPIHSKATSMSPADLGPILKDVLGKGYGSSIKVLQTDFEELEKRIRALGGFVETETIAKLKTFGDTLDLLANVIAVQFAPTILHVMEMLMDGVSRYLGDLDKHSRPQVPGESAESKGGLLSGLWTTSGKVGSAIMGGVSGVLGLADEAFGRVTGSSAAYAKAEDRLVDAMGWFRMAGISGGWTEDAADEIAKRISSGKGGLKESWDQVIAQWKKEAAELAAKLKNPDAGKFDVTQVPGAAEKDRKSKEFHASGDALIRVGNFLGSSKSVLEDIAQRQVQLLQELVNQGRDRKGLAFDVPLDSDFAMS